jgi:hypothetical protein
MVTCVSYCGVECSYSCNRNVTILCIRVGFHGNCYLFLTAKSFLLTVKKWELHYASSVFPLDNVLSCADVVTWNSSATWSNNSLPSPCLFIGSTDLIGSSGWVRYSDVCSQGIMEWCDERDGYWHRLWAVVVVMSVWRKQVEDCRRRGLFVAASSALGHHNSTVKYSAHKYWFIDLVLWYKPLSPGT